MNGLRQMMGRTAAGLVIAASALAAQAAPLVGDAAAGQAQFATCTRCHRVGPGARSGFGPQLNGIVGRRAGSLSDFNYSPALKQSQLVWTRERLAAFIKNPDQVVPGNRMRFASWGYDDQKIANLVAYLASFPAER